MMDSQSSICKVEKIPKMRNIIIDLLEEASKSFKVHAVFEIDVTKSRQIIKDYINRTGESLSFTGYIVYVVAKMVDKYKYMHAIRSGKEIYTFEDVDISVLVEREDNKDKKVLVTYIVRSANKKTYREISQEIRTAQSAGLKGNCLGSDIDTRRNNLLVAMPKIIRKIIFWYMRKKPVRLSRKK